MGKQVAMGKQVTVVTAPSDQGEDEGLALVTGAALATAALAQEQAQEAQQAAAIGEAEIATALAEIRADHLALADLYRLIQAQANTHGETLDGILSLLEEWVADVETEPEGEPSEVVSLSDGAPAEAPAEAEAEEKHEEEHAEPEHHEAEPPQEAEPEPARKHRRSEPVRRRHSWGRHGR